MDSRELEQSLNGEDKELECVAGELMPEKDFAYLKKGAESLPVEETPQTVRTHPHAQFLVQYLDNVVCQVRQRNVFTQSM